MKLKHPLLALLSLLALPGCEKVGIWLANAPVSFADEKAQTDLNYGSAPHQKLDLYLPEGGSAPYPLIVYFYGGGWQGGSKDYYAFVAQNFTKRGYAVAIPDYAKYPPAKFPEFIEDSAKAVAWLAAHADKQKLDVNNIFLLGHSAGAHNAALLAADERYLADAGAPKGIIRAMAGLAGPYNFTPEEQVYKEIFGPPENYPNMRVPNFIDGGEPPMFLAHGDEDEVVGLFNTNDLTAAIRAKGGNVEVKTYPGTGHIGIVSPLSWWKNKDVPVGDDVAAFFGSQMAQD